MSTPASLSLAVLAALAAGSLAARTVGQEQRSRPSSWPPPPERIVNVNGEHTFGRGRSTCDVYTVPEDSWLIVTDFRRIDTGNLDPELDLQMRQRKARSGETVLYFEFSTSPFSSPTGLRFEPGSTVVLERNEPGSSKQPSRYSLIGYLVPAE